MALTELTSDRRTIVEIERASCRSVFETVVQRAYALLADLFGDLSKRGELSLDDPMVAAYHFAWLTIGRPLDTAMFRGVEAAAELDLDSNADAGVRVFLAAYAAI